MEWIVSVGTVERERGKREGRVNGVEFPLRAENE